MSSQRDAVQPSFDDLGTFLPEATFVVVDLETTGTGTDASITEIGAVKVKGGEVLGTFQTLVRPNAPIPAMVQVLTGITDQMVVSAPPIDEALPLFDEFARGTVLVAHNARFDIGFLQRGFEQLGMAWKRPTVIDTVALARCSLLRDEVRNCKLATLAAYFGAETVPNHRALSDARATVDVFHALLERVGNLGVNTVEDLVEFLAQVSPDRRAKRGWASSLPERPGVYWFVRSDPGKADEVLYVGKSNNLRRRTRSYFSAAEQRSRIHEMVRVATGLEHVECATSLEAEVRELRMILGLAPRYNRRSKRQEQVSWLKLTDEAFPRIAITRKVRAGEQHFGPFTSRDAANDVALALQGAFQVRRCTTRLKMQVPSPSCALADMGRCPAPCLLGQGAEQYSEVVSNVRRAWAGNVEPLIDAESGRMRKLVGRLRYEEAGELTRRLERYVHASMRFARLRALAACPEIVAGLPVRGGWDIHVVRYGRLAAAAHASSARARAVADDVRATAETVLPTATGLPPCTVEEAERVAAWLELPGIRLIEIDGEWAWPLRAGLTSRQLAQRVLGEDALPNADNTVGLYADESAVQPHSVKPTV
ncbi:DEDD exonuclease domain-containing protein [uncultured Tessaracoccus sp.]|uniref:DEDD exonuclease domain-containing protein n=1 Tax=uncultured Tessaracoccus sp. TaxID=905023 RepID=UPI00261AFB20|nr:DEDD exonuclease domain-containing protein [uncultured Tessaracoccus sp.]